MKRTFLLILVTIYSAVSYSNALTGIWEGTNCSDYNDGVSYGTYNFHLEEFGTNNIGKMSTYIQYFTDHTCTTKMNNQATQVVGTYTILDNIEDADKVYKLMFNYSHLNHPLYGTAKLSSHDHHKMTLCVNNRCQALVKKL